MTSRVGGPRTSLETRQTSGPFGILENVGVDSFIAVLGELRAERLIAAETADIVRSRLRSTS